MISRLSGIFVAGLSLLCAACVQKEFPPEKAQGIIADRPVHLDAEQVVLNSTQLDCGIQNELWDPPMQVANRTLCHLTDRGRGLKFDDDVVVLEPDNHQPYVQIRGDFKMQLINPSGIRDDGPGAKLLDGKLVAFIQHSCFPEPLPVMGVRRGKFSQDAAPVLRFTLENDGWHFDRIVH